MIPFVDLKTQYLSIKPEIDQAVFSVLESSAFILGKFVESFEKDFAAHCGASYALGVSSGTSALHYALLAAGVGPGDEVSHHAIRTFDGDGTPRFTTGARGRCMSISIPSPSPSIHRASKKRSRLGRRSFCRCISTVSPPIWTPFSKSRSAAI